MKKKSILFILLLSFLVNPLLDARGRGGRRGGHGRRGRSHSPRRAHSPRRGRRRVFSAPPRYRRGYRPYRWYNRWYDDWVWGWIGGVTVAALIANIEKTREAPERLDRSYITSEFGRIKMWVKNKLDNLNLRRTSVDELKTLRSLIIDRIDALNDELGRCGGLSRDDRDAYRNALDSFKRITKDRIDSYINSLK